MVWSIARRLAQDLSYGIPAEKLGISHGRSSKDGYHIYRVPPTISLGFPLLKICGSPSHSALPRDVDWQVLDARLLNRLWVELHQRQYFLRHAHFDGEPQLAGFSCSKRVVMRPMSARKLIREGFRSWREARRLSPRRLDLEN